MPLLLAPMCLCKVLWMPSEAPALMLSVFGVETALVSPACPATVQVDALAGTLSTVGKERQEDTAGPPSSVRWGHGCEVAKGPSGFRVL